MKRKVVLAWITVLTFAITACSAQTSGETGDGNFTAPEPPGEWASGLTIGCIPERFTFVWNEGHETATFHVFKTAHQSEQVAIGRQVSDRRY